MIYILSSSNVQKKVTQQQSIFHIEIYLFNNLM